MLKLSVRKFNISAKTYFSAIFLIVLVLLAYFIYAFGKQLKISQKHDFVALASSNLISTDQSLDELTSSLNMASANYKKITDSQAEDQKIDYNLIIQDTQRHLDQISSIKQNLQFQKKLVVQAQVPKEYENLKIDLLNYYDELSQLLHKLADNLSFEHDLLIILNSNVTNRGFSQNSVWQEGNPEKIISYYQDLKTKVNTQLNEILKLNISAKHQEYYDKELSYLKLLSSSIDKIINTLLIKPKTGVVVNAEEEPSQVEEAYEIAVNAQNKLEDLATQLIQARSSYYLSGESLDNFEKLRAAQQSLERQVKIIYQQLYVESN